MSDFPEGWTKQNLVACLEKIIDYRGKTPKKSVNGIVTLSAKSVKMGRIDYSQAYYISEETYESFMVRGFPKKGDILMTTEAPLGCIAKLDRDNVSVAQRLLTLRGKAGVLDNDYLMYFLSSRRGQHELYSRASGSTVQGIKRSEFEHVKILLPSSFEEQKTIAKILSSFDEKIELLREQNETLESLAQTIFKGWFVEQADKSWKEKRLGEYISIKHGFAFKGKHISTEKNDNILVTPGNFKIGGGFKTFKLKYYHDSEFPESYILKENDLVVTMTDLSKTGDTLGYPALIPKCSDGVYLHNQRIGRVLIESEISKYFIYFLMRTHDYQRYIVGSSTGTSVMHTSPTSIYNYTFIFPEKKLINDFSRISRKLIEKISNNTSQIEELTKIRGTILPKLMGGEIRAEGFDQ